MSALQADLLDRLVQHPLDNDEQDLLLAAMVGEAELGAAVAGTAPVRPQDTSAEHATGDASDKGIPTGAYLRSITVSGFRGIGPETTLDLTPGPGLTVVCGRNGSGKSSFAEALEVLLTGQIRRLDDRTAVWKSTWRCLHGGPPEVSAELLLEGSHGITRVTRSWKPQDKSFTDGAAAVRVPGEPDAGLERLGWSSALNLYRPFLSHAELEVLLDRPSQLYDQLNGLLGLEEVNDIIKRLTDARKRADAVVAAAKVQLVDLRSQLADCNDGRARHAEEMLEVKKTDLDGLQALATGGPGVDSRSLELLRRLQSLNGPTPSTVSDVVYRLKAAAQRMEEVGSSTAGDAAATADLLSAAVAHFLRHGPGDCPVCGRPRALDDEWLTSTNTQIERLHGQARELRDVTADAETAWHEAHLLVGAAPEAVTEADDVGIDSGDVVAAWDTWASAPRGEISPTALTTLADHLTRTQPPLQTAVAALQDAATAELKRRQDSWAPVATALSAWVAAERAGQEAKGLSARLKRVEAWMKSANDDLRNARLRPFAEGTVALWSQLRQESNVDLVRMALTGTTTNRAVDFQVTVDGNFAAGLGVMSQGEVNALALSVFLPRATSSESPLRFVVIDDPVQAMDPSKVDGMAAVLTDVATTRQVIVFTHDDRLPVALRNLQLPARIVEVTRQSESVVLLRLSRDPATDNLDDALRLVAGDEIPVPVTARVVPGLCRSALEETCFEIARRRRLARGDSHVSVEHALEGTTTTMTKLALALFDDAGRGGEVYGWLNQHIGHWAPDTIKAVNKGVHEPVFNTRGLVEDSRRLIESLREKLG